MRRAPEILTEASASPSTDYLIGIDDTDSLDSPGTGHHARLIGQGLQHRGYGILHDITRHQLLFDPRIPYTSHNSSLCLHLTAERGRRDAIIDLCRSYLLEHSAPGSDAALCVVERSAVDAALESYGRRAKAEILTREEAVALAAPRAVHLEGLTGDHGGMIGALAAVGLRHAGQDGRFVWRPNLRETTGILTAGEVMARTGIGAVRRFDTLADIDPGDRIDLRPWPRAVMVDHKAVLFVQRAGSLHDHFAWQLAPKSVFHSY
jgi:hypothetical protein